MPVLALVFGAQVVDVAVLAALGAFFDPAGMTARETMLPARTGLGRRARLRGAVALRQPPHRDADRRADPRAMGSLAYAAGPLGLVVAGLGVVAIFLPTLRRLDPETEPPPGVYLDSPAG